jgi:hypothetical protein
MKCPINTRNSQACLRCQKKSTWLLPGKNIDVKQSRPFKILVGKENYNGHDQKGYYNGGQTRKKEKADKKSDKGLQNRQTVA